MKIAFFLGSVDISGGTYVVYQHAMFAKAAGHDVTIVVLYPYSDSQMGWHPATRQLRFIPIAALGDERFDLAIATWWKTATELHLINAAQYGYFVQSIESRFYPEHELPLRELVDSTYDLQLPTVTEATWIRQYLGERHGAHAELVRNGIRKDLYTEHGQAIEPRPPRGKLRVLVEGPFGVHFKNVGKTLKVVRGSRCDSTWLLSSTALNWYPGVDRLFSRVPIESVPAIYRSCDVIVKLSFVEGMFGPPLEMFHCGGTAIVFDVSGHDEYIVNGTNALVLRKGDYAGVRDAINRLSNDWQELERLKQGARETARSWPDWETSSLQFERVLVDMLERPAVSRSELAERNRIAMARYVADENARLASTPTKLALLRRIAARLYRVPRLANYRRLAGYILESW